MLQDRKDIDRCGLHVHVYQSLFLLPLTSTITKAASVISDGRACIPRRRVAVAEAISLPAGQVLLNLKSNSFLSSLFPLLLLSFSLYIYACLEILIIALIDRHYRHCWQPGQLIALPLSTPSTTAPMTQTEATFAIIWTDVTSFTLVS